MENNLVDAPTREQIYLEQQRRRTERSLGFGRIIHGMRSVIGGQLLVAVLAAACVVLAHFIYGVSVASASEVAGFCSFCVCTLLEYLAERPGSRRSLSFAAYKVGRVFALLFLISLVIYVLYAVYSLNNTGDIITVHPDLDSKSRVALWLSKFKSAFVTLVVAVCLLLLYAIWKFYSQRYVEARMGALKDMIIRVESTLRDRTLSPEHNQTVSIGIVLKGLRNILKLSPWDRLTRKLKFYRKTAGLITVAYLEPEQDNKVFRIVDVAFPENGPDRALEGFSYLRDNYRPAFLDEDTFRHFRDLAKGENPKGWRERYLNFSGRGKYISACGWIFAKRETLLSKDALRCLAFDNSFVDDLKQMGYSEKEIEWIEVHSFIGCPVFVSDNITAGVLMALKNVRSGFVPEDLESAVIASQLIGRILQR
ncbi:MAG TPA: hypothetical protein VN937_21570 [Blastocatellia bacterium]|nr:hypothetical protein [Blastocatellia bacterium]